MKLIGVGHSDSKRISQNLQSKAINVILLPGIGDIIYTWYKLIHYINDGYVFNVKVLDCQPQRSHQILGCLEGMKSFEYIGNFDYSRYWLVNMDDIRTPPLYGTFNNMPVLHINSFLETSQNIDVFMPSHPANYNININTNEESVNWAQNINKEYYNIVLYSSSYENNIHCNVHPDPSYWIKLSLLCYRSDKPLYIYLIGASYDTDLTIDIYNELKNLNIECQLLIDEDFYHIIELIRNVDFVVAYESGMAIIANCFNIPLFHVIRCQGGERDDKKFPFLGPINPSTIGDSYHPVFYDETIEQIEEKLWN